MVKQSQETSSFSQIKSPLKSKETTNPPPPLSPSFRSKNSQRISIIRTFLLVVISLVGFLSGGLSYFFIRKYQAALYEEQFDSMIEHHFKGMQRALLIQLYSNIQLAAALELICPSKDDWPNCSVPMKTFDARTQMFEFSSQRRLALVPIVQPQDRESFERFALDYYLNQGGYTNGTGSNGIYPRDISSPNNQSFFAPLLYLSNQTSDSPLPLLFDLSSDTTMSETIDHMIDCVNLFAQGANSEINQAQQNCSEVTNFLPTLLSNDLTIVTPILSTQSQASVVGILASLVSWETLLKNSLHADFNFRCVIQSSTTPSSSSSSSGKDSFLLRKGKVSRIPERKSHELEESDDHLLKPLQRSYPLSSPFMRSETVYSITYYSSDEMPLPFVAVIACVSCLFIAIAIIVIFFSFNAMVESAALESCRLLDSKRTYVRFVSHEIRTPLNTISLSTRLISENLLALKNFNEDFTELIVAHHENFCKSNERIGCEDEESCSFLTKVMSLSSPIDLLIEESLELIGDLDENSSVAVSTLNDLINYDKIESKTFSIEEKDVNPWSVLRKTVGPMTLQAKEKNIELKIVTQASDPLQFPNENLELNLTCLRVVGDSIKLAQVIRNLVSNALKFTPRDGKVTISAYFEPLQEAVSHLSRSPFPSRSHVAPFDEIGHVVISVTDSGPGLSEEQLCALFHEGVQFNPNKLQAGQGSGLGLWISKEIVNLHHGQIEAKSDGLGCGATFEVKLPVVLRDSTEVTRPSQSVPFHTIRTQPSRTQLLSLNSRTVPTHVLVVDDAASNRKLVSRLLKSKGFICHEAEDGQECVDKVLAREHPYEFILLDYEMPVMDGPSAARRLREEKCDLLIIGVTGNVLPEDKAHFMNQGANLVMEKPLNVNELIDELKKYSKSKA